MTKTVKKKELKQNKTPNKFKIIAMMFPENHNNIVRCVCAGWDEGTNKGELFIEHNFPNCYMDKKYTNLESFESKEELLKKAEELVESIAEDNIKLKKELSFESEETFFVSFFDKGKCHTVKCPSCPIYITEDQGAVEITILSTAKIKYKKPEHVYIDVTNDPTLKFAGGWVSLGYYNWRISMKKCIVTTEDPIRIICQKEDMIRTNNRPTRRPD